MSFSRSAEEPHDVLAAEQFPLGAADPVLCHRGPLRLAPDPAGVQQPHDVLAAEEFPLPAPMGRHPAACAQSGWAAASGMVALGVAALLALRALRQWRLARRAMS